MSTLTSRDGTTIAYERLGDCPPRILVGGAADDGSENAPLAPALAGTPYASDWSRRMGHSRADLRIYPARSPRRHDASPTSTN
jgi:hypothetical protein